MVARSTEHVDSRLQRLQSLGHAVLAAQRTDGSSSLASVCEDGAVAEGILSDLSQRVTRLDAALHHGSFQDERVLRQRGQRQPGDGADAQ